MNTACKIIEAVSSHFKVTAAQIEGPPRKFEWPRLVAMALCYRHTDFNLDRIGTFFNRTHGAVINANKSVASATIIPKYRDQVEAVKRIAGL